MMTLEEQKLAVCEKLPELIEITDTESPYPRFYWKGCKETGNNRNRQINCPTEGLQVCHEAEKLLTLAEKHHYHDKLLWVGENNKGKEGKISDWWMRINATYEQRLEALCRVWYPERFK